MPRAKLWPLRGRPRCPTKYRAPLPRPALRYVLWLITGNTARDPPWVILHPANTPSVRSLPRPKLCRSSPGPGAPPRLGPPVLASPHALARFGFSLVIPQATHLGSSCSRRRIRSGLSLPTPEHPLEHRSQAHARLRSICRSAPRPHQGLGARLPPAARYAWVLTRNTAGDAPWIILLRATHSVGSRSLRLDRSSTGSKPGQSAPVKARLASLSRVGAQAWVELRWQPSTALGHHWSYRKRPTLGHGCFGHLRASAPSWLQTVARSSSDQHRWLGPVVARVASHRCEANAGAP